MLVVTREYRHVVKRWRYVDGCRVTHTMTNDLYIQQDGKPYDFLEIEGYATNPKAEVRRFKPRRN